MTKNTTIQRFNLLYIETADMRSDGLFFVWMEVCGGESRGLLVSHILYRITELLLVVTVASENSFHETPSAGSTGSGFELVACASLTSWNHY